VDILSRLLCWLFCAVLSSHSGFECAEVGVGVAQVEVRVEMTAMKISPDGIAAIYRRECPAPGFEPVLTAYDDGSGNLTIGCGHSGPDVKAGMTITRAEADALFLKDIAPCEEAVNTNVTVGLSQHEFDALCSFSFNVGTGAFQRSTLLKKLNAGNYEAVTKELERWNQSNGKVNAGLVNRRKSEIAQWLNQPFVASASVRVDPPPSKWVQMHNWLKSVGGACLGLGIGAPDLQNAGAQFQGLANVSHYFAYLGFALIVAGIVYNLIKPKS